MKYLFFVIGLLKINSIYAHPVSFQGSTGLMSYHSPMISHTQVNYSHRYWFATGVHHIKRPDVKDRHATFASTNFLLKRWNEAKFQANLYTNLGVGISQLGENPEGAAMGLVQFDIEDREYYFLAKHTRVQSEVEKDLAQYVIRAGIAPYVVNFDGIHSWLILEWMSSDFSGDGDISDLTPFLRVFYKNLLFEIGQSFYGDTKFNFITHF